MGGEGEAREEDGASALELSGERELAWDDALPAAGALELGTPQLAPPPV